MVRRIDIVSEPLSSVLYNDAADVLHIRRRLAGALTAQDYEAGAPGYGIRVRPLGSHERFDNAEVDIRELLVVNRAVGKE